MASKQAGDFAKLIEIGIALSVERNTARLMERILLEAKKICNADGGTLYLLKDDRLSFEIVRTDSLDIAMGGTTGVEITFAPLPLYDPATGAPNDQNVATHAALSGRSINIPDAYEAEDFDFSGTKRFDAGTGYLSRSFLTVPLKNHDGQVIGILQLLNAQDPDSGEVVPFSAEIQPLVEALASQAAVALDNSQLIDAQRALLDAFIELIASAIDAKSPYTGGHCQRVPEVTRMLAEAACASAAPPFADFDLDEDGWHELRIAAWLHDCGKVTTPEYVVDKATKLETIYNRIHEVRTRFEVVKRDTEIAYLKGLLDGGDAAELAAERDARLAQLDEDFAFVAECNIGGEFMDEKRMERLARIGETTWTRTLDDRTGLSIPELQQRQAHRPNPVPAVERLLADKPEHMVPRDTVPVAAGKNRFGFELDVPEYDANLGELYNLCIPRGTLTNEERFKINDHIVQTIVMLEQLPFPRTMRRVPEYAGGHHEKMDGTGYPRRLSGEQMSLPARIMAVADIFEALTAADRPYKPAKKLSESIRIMSFMAKDAHIDRDLFELFLTSGVYRDYAEAHLLPEQIDEVDVAQYVNGGA
ncbi:MAG: GAF domain-containing protein [Hyphomicrobiales bacterium]|nr:GAF domain-containing protein [Hyphomicrobiales bacterium]